MNSQKVLEKVLEFARKSIYDKVQYLGKWNSFDIWEPVFSDGAPRFIGFPQFILIKGETIRWSKNWKESQEIMSHFG